MCRNGGKTRKSLKSHKTVTSRKNVKNITFSRLTLNVTGPNAKLEMQKIWLRPCLTISFLSQFPPDQATTLTLPVTSSLSHTLPDSRLRPIVPSLSHTLPISLRSLTPFPFFLSPFTNKLINHFPPDPEHSWRDEGKNWFSIPSFVFFV